jgi:hypothetical protein
MANGDSSNPWDAMTPSATASGLSPDDPLRSWFQSIDDPATISTFLHDPEKAKDMLAAKGVPPPPISAAVPPAGSPAPTQDQPSQGQFAAPQAPPAAGGALPFSDATGKYTLDPNTGMPIFDNTTGKMMGNLTSAQGQKPQPPPVQPAPPAPLPAPTGNATPVTQPNVPPPGTTLDPTEKEDGDGETKKVAEAKKPETPEEAKKRKIDEALKGFSDSLKGVQAPKLPPPPQIGAPGVRSASAIQAPQLASLLALAGQRTPAAIGLARLLGRG